MNRGSVRNVRGDCGTKLIDRRTVSLGLASLVVGSNNSIAQGAGQPAGCAYLHAGCSFVAKATDAFLAINPMSGNSQMAIAVLGVELAMLLQVSASPAFYNDAESGPNGNAGAMLKPLFPAVQGVPPVDGTVVFGAKCYEVLGNKSAAIAAVYAHEMGHLLQNKFISTQLYDLRNQDKSVVRAELHADFVCGYYAAFRKQKQSDWDALMQAIIQFKFGDYQYANPLHHGTPSERKAAVNAGFQFGSRRMNVPPAEVADSGLGYVRSLTLDKTSKSQFC